MSSALRIVFSLFLVWHGLIHLMYVVAYLRLAEIDPVPYKTTLLSGRWDVGDRGIRIFGILWLLAAIGFVIAAIGLGTEQDWLPTLLVGIAVLSTVLSALDLKVAYGGVAIGIVIVLAVLVGPQVV